MSRLSPARRRASRRTWRSSTPRSRFCGRCRPAPRPPPARASFASRAASKAPQRRLTFVRRSAACATAGSAGGRARTRGAGPPRCSHMRSPPPSTVSSARAPPSGSKDSFIPSDHFLHTKGDLRKKAHPLTPVAGLPWLYLGSAWCRRDRAANVQSRPSSILPLCSCDLASPAARPAPQAFFLFVLVILHLRLRVPPLKHSSSLFL